MLQTYNQLNHITAQIGLASIIWQTDRWSCRNQQLIAITKAATKRSTVGQATLVGHCVGNSQCG